MDAAASTETETDYDYGVCTLMPEANRRPSRYTGVASTYLIISIPIHYAQTPLLPSQYPVLLPTAIRNTQASSLFCQRVLSCSKIGESRVNGTFHHGRSHSTARPSISGNHSIAVIGAQY